MPAKKSPKAKPAKAKAAKPKAAKVKPMKKGKRKAKAMKAVKVAKSTGFDLPSALKAKIKASGLSVAAAAKQMGVTALSVDNTLKGKSSPNARTVKKYAAFLGVAAKLLAKEKPVKVKGRRGRPPGSGKKRGRPPGKGKARRGRPPGSEKKRGRPPGTGKKRGRPPGKGKGRRGRPPGTGKKRGRPPGRRGRPLGRKITIKAGRFPKGAMTQIAKSRKAVEAILTDKLAIRVHNMKAGERAKLEKILK
jgi:ribosome-binding protein aMBF1 (putative translation factor)